jgi:hypothetical protein
VTSDSTELRLAAIRLAVAVGLVVAQVAIFLIL